MKLETLDYVVLIVADLDRSLPFYTELLGLTLQHRTATYAQIEAGTTRLGLYTREAMEQTLGVELGEASSAAPAFELGFKVANVDAAHRELVAAGASSAAPPTTRPWGQRTAYLRDPDGNLIELAQDVDPHGTEIGI